MSTIAVDITVVENTSKLTIVRRDSKDSCFSEEMVEDFSATHIDDSCRLSPLALAPCSRKSSATDSAVCMEYDAGEGTLSRENSFKRNFEGSSSMMTAANGVKDVNNDRLALLEERLKQMEMQLKNETENRLKLEKKVQKLEEENDQLSVLRSKAASQLQSFSEKFFALPEPKYISPVGTPLLHSPAKLQSPRHSQIELRRVASNTSVLKRLSGQSFPTTLKSRHSNISL